MPKTFNKKVFLACCVLFVAAALMGIRYWLVTPIEFAGNRKVQGFREAKHLLRKLDSWDGKTFYCSCAYARKKVDVDQCEFAPAKQVSCFREQCSDGTVSSPRMYRLEWEHLVPASRFGRSFRAWRSGNPRCRRESGKPFKGRACARLVSAEFRFIEADLYNIVPAVGSVNALRSAKRPGLLDRRAFSKGKTLSVCRLILGDKFMQPAEDIRGMVARAYLYMSQVYPHAISLSRKEKQMFVRWHETHPPSYKEREWARSILRIQGNRHPFIDVK